MSRKGTQDGRTQGGSVNLVSGWKNLNTRLRVINSKIRDDGQFYCREALWHVVFLSIWHTNMTVEISGHHIRRAAEKAQLAVRWVQCQHQQNKTTTKRGSFCLYSQHSGSGDRRSEVQGQPWAI